MKLYVLTPAEVTVVMQEGGGHGVSTLLLTGLAMLLRVLIADVLEHVGGGVGVGVPSHGVTAQTTHGPPSILGLESEVEPHWRAP